MDRFSANESVDIGYRLIPHAQLCKIGKYTAVIYRRHPFRRVPGRARGETWLTGDGNAAKAGAFLDVKDVLDLGIERETDRVRNETVFKFFHGTNHVRLELRGHVVMDDTDPT
jgi:hypothetical protein